METGLLAILAQQDYLWFLVCFGWICAAGLSALPSSGEPRFAWRVWLAAHVSSGLIVAAMETLWLLWPMSSRPDRPAAAAEIVLVAGLALGVTGSLLALRPAFSSVWMLVAVALGAAGVIGHAINPFAAGVALATCSVLAAGRLAWQWRRSTEPAPGWRAAAAIAAGLHPLLSSAGPLAEMLGGSHRLVALSGWSLAAALLQLFATFFAIRAGLETGRTPLVRVLGNDFIASLKRAGAWLTGWLVAGFLLAWVSGNLAAHHYDAGLLVRANTAAGWFNKTAVEQCLVPEFKVDRFDAVKQEDGSLYHGARSSFIAAQAKTALRPELTQVLRSDPAVVWATIVTQRSRWLVSFAMPERVWWDQDWVDLLRPLEAEDRIRWAQRRAWIEEPSASGVDVVRVFAPLVSRRGHMLGWLEIVYSPTDRARSQVQARFQTFALVGLGILVGLLFFIQRLRRQQEEAAHREAALSAEADRTKTAFLAKVSHELRTPLQSMLGYGELLAQQPLDPQSRRWLAASQAHGAVLVRLVSDLIDLSALQMGAFRLVERPVKPLDLVRQIAQSLEPGATKKGLSLRFTGRGDETAWVLADGDRLRQIAVNLIHNAIKFTASGVIEVRATLVPGERGSAESLELAVADTGPGISPAEQLLLFQPFRRLRASENQEGSGLGLALTAALCRAMRGSILVHSDGQTGSTFVARLELQSVAAPAPAPEIVATDALAGRRILVADDNALVRQLFEAFLLNHGAQVDLVDNGEAALAACATATYDALVLDVSMPRLTGWEVSSRLLGQPSRPGLVVGVSAHATPSDQERAAAAGMDRFLTKPVSMAAFVSALVPDLPGKTAAEGSQWDELRAGWCRQFWSEAPGLLERLEVARATGDWAQLRQLAHYLKNSADVIGFESLSAHCAQLEGAGDAAGSDHALTAVRRHLANPPPSVATSSF